VNYLAVSPQASSEIGKKIKYLQAEQRTCRECKDYVISREIKACTADETKPRYSPSANQRPKACSAPAMLPGFSIIGSYWLLHMAVLSCTVIGRVDLVEPWLLSQ